ncbi:putative flavin-containing monoamine oxidase A [Penicillium verrucosum]|uniref:putative flavin-containing monoamine oxidase A n=1 Tax=Penicillium verrucosum TaxID=60171 RepID=UPI0025457305|nr:putative flavin-containing monoamine oxidase A [Penicillium verrucosum]KAJ5922868.1 putative flavin-containing monoamine oxidase A [Penicillium verrucosum]
MLSYIAAAGNQTNIGTINRLIGTKEAAHDSRINGGTQLLATRLAEKLRFSKIVIGQRVPRLFIISRSSFTEAEEFSTFEFDVEVDKPTHLVP